MTHRWISSVSSLQPPRPRQKIRSDWLIPPSILRRLSSHAGSGDGEERGFCDPGSEENANYPWQHPSGACYRVYNDSAGGRGWTKGSRDRGEKTDAGKDGISRAACPNY